MKMKVFLLQSLLIFVHGQGAYWNIRLDILRTPESFVTSSEAVTLEPDIPICTCNRYIQSPVAGLLMSSTWTTHRPCDSTLGICDGICYHEFSKYDANAFLSSGKRSTPRECCHESYCESQGTNCQTEQYRSYLANKYPCPAGKMVTTTANWCPRHYIPECRDICDALGRERCENGGTCVPAGASYMCSCMPGFEGRLCQVNIDDCASSPCKNGATCEDKVNSFKCHCPPRIYGVLCDTNICHPTPADVVFVLDSSISMAEEQFQQQLEFVANFSRNVPIGPRDFQIGVITFSSDAHIEFYLNQYSDNSSLIDAVMNITYKPGATRTDLGLQAIETVFSKGHGIERRVNNTKADRFVYVLTDGMSLYRQKTKNTARTLKDNVVDVYTIASIGIGYEVLHQELVDIASDPSYVYSVQNFNSLYTVLKRLVHFDCDECENSAASDVAIFLDSSHALTIQQYDASMDALIHIIDVMKRLSLNETHVSVTSFSDVISTVISMGETFDKDAIKTRINLIGQPTDQSQIPMENIYLHARTQTFNSHVSRKDAKKILLIFTNGNHFVKDEKELEKEKLLLDADEVNIIAIGSGEHLNLQGLYRLVRDNFYVFINNDDLPKSNLDVLQSEFVYNKCDLKGE